MSKITYYNFVSGYKDDVSTSGCGVTKRDLDLNFYNLKSEDVKEAYWDTDLNGIVLAFNDGSKIEITDIDPYKLGFNEVDYLLTGKTADGSEFGLKGANVQPTEKPVISVVTEYPSGITEIRKRYILKDTSEIKYRTYTKSEVLLIDSYLKNHGFVWRVATKSDWDGMLNAMEICDEDRNHSTESEGGRIAGDILKGKKGWNEPYNGIDTYGFNVIPCNGDGIAPFAAIENGDVYCKLFNEESGPVYTLSAEQEYYFIRLVKDSAFDGTYNILGTNYDTQSMPYWTESGTTSKTWTKENFAVEKISKVSVGQTLGSTIKDKYSIIESIAPFSPERIQWNSYRLQEGEGVFCINDNTIYTLRLSGDNEYLETLNDIYNDAIVDSKYNPENKSIDINFNDNNVIKTISLNISDLIDSISQDTKKLEDAISAETKERIQDFETLSGSIVALSGNVIAYVDEKTSTVYRIKGSVETYDDLLAVENPQVGDVYNVINSGTTDEGKEFAEGSNFVWNGDKWDILGGTFDFKALEKLKKDVNELSAATIAGFKSASADTVAVEDKVKELSAGTITYVDELKYAAINSESGTTLTYAATSDIQSIF